MGKPSRGFEQRAKLNLLQQLFPLLRICRTQETGSDLFRGEVSKQELGVFIDGVRLL